MGAGGFGTLAGHFADRTVVTYDPRGVERSRKADDQRIDPRRSTRTTCIGSSTALGVGPVDLFASSGGAVNALALVAAHPERRADARRARAAARAGPAGPRRGAGGLTRRSTTRTCAAASAPAWRSSSRIVSHKGRSRPSYADQPGPDPAMFGLPTEDDGSRNDPLVGQNIISCTHYEPDFDALRAASTRIVIAVGAESEGELAHRGGEAVAERLGHGPVIFPSDHGGFLGGEYGQQGDPDAFAAKLREVLAANS